MPPGVTVQLANNICYGGKLVELTDADAGVCVFSQVDATRPSRSQLDSSPFIGGYIKGLGKKSFQESYQEARAADLFSENIGSMNSLDYFVGNEMKKNKSAAAPVCTTANTAGSANAAAAVAQPMAIEADILAVQAQIAKAQEDTRSNQKKQAQFLDNEYRTVRNELSSVHQKIYNLKPGPERDLAYGAYNKKADAIEAMKKAYEVKLKNLKEYIANYEKQITFLKTANPQQLEKYRKIKKCMERTI